MVALVGIAFAFAYASRADGVLLRSKFPKTPRFSRTTAPPEDVEDADGILALKRSLLIGPSLEPNEQ